MEKFSRNIIYYIKRTFDYIDNRKSFGLDRHLKALLCMCNDAIYRMKTNNCQRFMIIATVLITINVDFILFFMIKFGQELLIPKGLYSIDRT